MGLWLLFLLHALLGVVCDPAVELCSGNPQLVSPARPVEEQEKELKAVCWTLPVTGHVEPPLAAEGVGPAPPKSLGVGHEATGGRYGQGMVQAAECSDIDRWLLDTLLANTGLCENIIH